MPPVTPRLIVRLPVPPLAWATGHTLYVCAVYNDEKFQSVVDAAKAEHFDLFLLSDSSDDIFVDLFAGSSCIGYCRHASSM